jgi:hypothetical protein
MLPNRPEGELVLSTRGAWVGVPALLWARQYAAACG